MPCRRALGPALLAMALSVFGALPAVSQCVSLTTTGSAATQNFNTLANTGTSGVTPTGWFFAESGANANATYSTGTGSGNAGDTYSFGAAGNSERAFGGLLSNNLTPVIGACFTNNTGGTLSSLDIAYTGEQWRIGINGAARDDRLDFQYSLNATSLTTGTWSDVDALDFVNPIKTAAAAGALDGNAAANRTAISNSIASLSIANGATFWIRWNDFNAASSDDGLAVDDFSLTPQGGGPVIPALSIDDVSLGEGNAGTTSFLFTVSLSAPAGPGGVTFDIATANNTAVAPGDYTTNSLTGQTIPAGSSTYAFTVLVNGDTTAEANETFLVNVTGVTGATVAPGQGTGTGTINNDDVSLTPIHDIQGPGNSSPIVGATVTTRGIVTGIKNNGFFIQEPDATVDADPATSEGVFVFTSSAPAGTILVGDQVQVTATVIEFVPTQDPLQPPLTELSSPTVTELSAGNPLPTAVTLSASFPDPAGPVDQLERLEGMRVQVASLTVVAPTLGNVNEPNATATSTGVFFGVVTGVARPFREPGIQAPDPAPSGGSIPPIPRWDANPELLRVDSDGIGAAIVNVGTGAVVTGLVGPLDYGFRHYTVLPESTPATAGGPTPVSVTAPTGREFTIAAYNLERFFDTVNDPGIGEPVLTAAAYDKRLAKASLGIRNYLQTPDILGIIEIENLATLQDLADRINSDAGAASPEYEAYLVEGNDVGGIDVGFLVKTAEVAAGVERVEVVEVQQELDGTLLVNPDSSTSILNDRPPLRLEAIVHHPNGASYPVTVIVNHMRSLNGSTDEAPGTNGWPTAGARVRAKRQAQAEDLANLVQSLQTADPAQPIVLIGDFNAFEFNDGLGDSMGVIEGTPSPDAETAVPGDGVDLVNPDLDNLADTAPAAERYSFLFDGNAQSLDHVVVNQALIASTAARRVEHPRINADFPEIDRNPAGTTRLADHDPIVAFFQVAEFATAGLTISKTDLTDPVTAGTQLGYTIEVVNGGPDDAATLEVTDPLPAGTTFVSLTAPAGWSCTTPAVGASGTVTCTNALLANGGSATFNLVVAVDPAVAAGTLLSNTATVTTTTSDDTSDNSATATTTVGAAADYSLTLTDAPDPVVNGTTVTYTAVATNGGPSVVPNATVTLTLSPAVITLQSFTPPAGWICPSPGVVGQPITSVVCSLAAFAPGTATFTLVLNVGAGTPGGTVLVASGALTGGIADSDPGDTTPIATTMVSSAASLSATKTATGPFTPGATFTYTIVVTNGGPSTQGDNPGNELTDVLPAPLQLVSASASSGTVVADTTNETVTWNGELVPTASATITIQAAIPPGTPSGTTISNQASLSYDADGNGTNEASGVSDNPAAAGGDNPTDFVVGEAVNIAEIPTLDQIGLMALAAILAMLGAWRLRRRQV